MTQVCARSESRIRIAFDQSLELHSFASSILSATAGAIGEEMAGDMEGRRRRRIDGGCSVRSFACVLGERRLRKTGEGKNEKLNGASA